VSTFDYPNSQDPIRQDLAEAHRRAWAHVAGPGTWLTGAERVAVADETRRARGCGLCAERKAALSPYSVSGEHDHAGLLAAPLVDEIHRVTTDAQRLTRAWHESLLEQGLTVEAYVEALGVAVIVISVDRFHHAMGLAPELLPEPRPGEPSHYRPPGTVSGEAWVPMLDTSQTGPAERELLPRIGGRTAHVLRALSLVPDEVRAWFDLSAAQYLGIDKMAGFDTGRAIDRSQVELIAGRVSALNECFY
jgi:alkylhydroperoxidase family enzyme